MPVIKKVDGTIVEDGYAPILGDGAPEKADAPESVAAE